jgi:hypothetical protein
MGILDDFGSVIPADKLESFKTAISAFDGAVKIDSRETVEKLASENQFVKSAIDAAISRAVASHDEKFKAEKLPTLIDDELKKRGPKPKDPELAAALDRVEALEKAKTQAEREIYIANQRAKVLPKITELGIDADLADILIGNTDAETDARLDKLVKSVTKARDGYTEKVLKDRFGNSMTPPGGGSAPTTVEQLGAKYADLMGKRQFQQALVVQDQIARMRTKNG